MLRFGRIYRMFFGFVIFLHILLTFSALSFMTRWMGPQKDEMELKEAIKSLSFQLERVQSGDRAAYSQFLNTQSDIEKKLNEKTERQEIALVGSWSLALLSFLGLFGLVYLNRKIQFYVFDPIHELCRGVKDWDNGNKMRRLRIRKRNDELQAAMILINELFDEKRAQRSTQK